MSLDNFNWSKKQKFELEGYEETLPADALDRQKYAKFITNFVISEGYDSETKSGKNYVLNLNAEWGSGKTYFIKRLYQSLKGHHPVVYIDAWKQDYCDDPLLTVVSSVITQLRVQAGKNEDDVPFSVPRKFFSLVKSSAPTLLGAVTKRYVGIDFRELFQADDDENVEIKDKDDKPLDLGKVATEITNSLIKDHETKANAISSLKRNVKQWVEALIGSTQNSSPAFVLIDELDRCRPSYAVEMLEIIKHIFDLEGIVFVVATDTEQLQHTIRAVYGEGFDASRYLARFFHSRFTLKQADFKKLLPIHCNISLLDSKVLQEKRNIILWPYNTVENHTKNLTEIFTAFQLPARTAIQVTNRIISIITNLSGNEKLDILMLGVLFSLREIDEALYQKVVTSINNNKLDSQLLNQYLYSKKRYGF